MGRNEEGGLQGPREEEEAQEKGMFFFTARRGAREGRMETRNC